MAIWRDSGPIQQPCEVGGCDIAIRRTKQELGIYQLVRQCLQCPNGVVPAFIEITQFLHSPITGRNLRGVVVVVVMSKTLKSQANLPEITGAYGLVGPHPAPADRRQQQGGENPDDGDDHQQFDQGESDDLPAVPVRFHV